MARRDPTRDELEDGLRYFLHQLTESRLTQADHSATLKALIDTLVQSGVIAPEQLERRRQKNLDVSVERLKTRPLVQLDKTEDKYALTDLPQIDCASIIPICKARCCRLVVCLSRQDLDEREIDWDYGKPYQIRRRKDGYCVHSDEETRGCGVYHWRPAICRSYDCREDKRIWKDFENRILADQDP
jgi:Fe-S-cluster containining protein